MLYKRDFKVLNSEEKIKLLEAEKIISESKEGFGMRMDIISKYHKKLPHAYYYFNSLFPNNYLDTKKL